MANKSRVEHVFARSELIHIWSINNHSEEAVQQHIVEMISGHNLNNDYHKQYPWYPMSPTVHKVLIHGHQIIENCLVSVGSLGEQAAESRNKLYKSDRRGHARKCSRLDNITDVFNRAMDTSDPLLSSLNERKTKKKQLPNQVIAMLISPNIDQSHTNDGRQEEGDGLEEEEEDDSEEEDELNFELDVDNSDDE